MPYYEPIEDYAKALFFSLGLVFLLLAVAVSDWYLLPACWMWAITHILAHVFEIMEYGYYE